LRLSQPNTARLKSTKSDRATDFLNQMTVNIE
jgi:hypothetical protein